MQLPMRTMSSLAKLPILILVTACLHICYKQPNPPAAKEHQRAHMEEIGFKSVIMIHKLQRVLCWILGVLEAATIISNHSVLQGIGTPIVYITRTNIIGALLIMAGTYIRNSSFVALGPVFTFEVNILKGHKLVKHWPYSVIRHPSYTGLVMTFFGATLWFCTPGSFLHESTGWVWKIVEILLAFMYFPVCVLIACRIPGEDGLLRKQFGAEWEDWARKVPYKLIPYIY
ncbi:hypothetical protein M378DRAFT_585208 [Amanita muscaria Koide BX008]|uniref:Uncharacterized protein n=1 Tax=Amanita muscaria (strain Koide BX008) TaxID=946122 RepID=A0A0C2TC51_AMAMK|nr:hypothetical protein M378DRAFT_585208 [Amanita muscaria Koide BX008]